MKKGIKTCIQEIRGYKRQAGFLNTTFLRSVELAEDQKKALEQEQQYEFDLWWNTWIAPLLDEIEKRA